MSFEITAFYASLLAILVVLLGTVTMIFRAKSDISFGYGENFSLQKSIRSHGNLIEYAPIFLICMLFLENSGADTLWLHVIGTAFLIGRIALAGYFQIKQLFMLRVLAFWLTMVPILALAILLLT